MVVILSTKCFASKKIADIVFKSLKIIPTKRFCFLIKNKKWNNSKLYYFDFVDGFLTI